MLGELLDGPLALDVPLEAQLPKRLLQHSGQALPQLGDDPLDPVQQHLCPCRLMGRGPVKEVQMGGGGITRVCGLMLLRQVRGCFE